MNSLALFLAQASAEPARGSNPWAIAAIVGAMLLLAAYGMIPTFRDWVKAKAKAIFSKKPPAPPAS
jgi:hypothetical protein